MSKRTLPFPALAFAASLVLAAVLLATPAAGAPAAAGFNESFSCGVQLQGSDLLLPEQVVLDHTWVGPFYTWLYTGTAETEGIGVPLPRAELDMSGQGLLGGPQGASWTRCNGHAEVLYELEVEHLGGVEGRFVPLRVASKGSVTASASSWGSLGSVSVRLRVIHDDGTLTYEQVQACDGTAFSGCNTIPQSNALDVILEVDTWVPAGLGATAREEISIWAVGYMDVFVEMWDPGTGGVSRAGNATIAGWIDPQVWIDPSWEYADEYSLAFSAGVPVAPDADGDAMPDDYDNCRDVSNPDQKDIDAPNDDDTSLAGIQHYGDACDADLDDDGIVGPADFFGAFRPCLGVDPTTDPTCAEADMDGDGVVGTSDFFGKLRPALGTSPGPGTTEP